MSTSEHIWISAKDAARKLGYAPEYVANLCRTGQLVSERIDGSWRIEESSVEAYRVASQQEKELRSKTLSRVLRKESREQKLAPEMLPTLPVLSAVAEPEITKSNNPWIIRFAVAAMACMMLVGSAFTFGGAT